VSALDEIVAIDFHTHAQGAADGHDGLPPPVGAAQE
jgi:hypothetical protein